MLGQFNVHYETGEQSPLPECDGMGSSVNGIIEGFTSF